MERDASLYGTATYGVDTYGGTLYYASASISSVSAFTALTVTFRGISINSTSSMSVSRFRFVDRAAAISSASTIASEYVIVSMAGRNLQTTTLVDEESRSVNVHTRRNAV
jgi:phage gp37-like protein